MQTNKWLDIWAQVARVTLCVYVWCAVCVCLANIFNKATDKFKFVFSVWLRRFCAAVIITNSRVSVSECVCVGVCAWLVAANNAKTTHTVTHSYTCGLTALSISSTCRITKKYEILFFSFSLFSGLPLLWTHLPLPAPITSSAYAALSPSLSLFLFLSLYLTYLVEQKIAHKKCLIKMFAKSFVICISLSISLSLPLPVSLFLLLSLFLTVFPSFF